MESFLKNERIISREREYLQKRKHVNCKKKKGRTTLIEYRHRFLCSTLSLFLSFHDAKQSAVVICTSKHRVKNLKGCAFNSSGRRVAWISLDVVAKFEVNRSKLGVDSYSRVDVKITKIKNHPFIVSSSSNLLIIKIAKL